MPAFKSDDEKLSPYTILLTPGARKRLNKISHMHELSMSSYVRSVLMEHIANVEKSLELNVKRKK